MHIEHVAIWTKQLERLKDFYTVYFQAIANDKYVNPSKQFESYFLTFSSGARLELMQMPTIPDSANSVEAQATGLIHLAFSLGSSQQVDDLTARLRQAGYPVIDGPRWTGDGYYESCVLDPDGNRLELTS
ncbi:MAG: VOC family protein [Thermoflexales bacterium]|nr:VOC family protein [Thermoflexales bacterium]